MRELFIDVPACKTRLYFSKGKGHGLYNIERVRQVWEKNTRMSPKQIAAILDLHPTTVCRALKVIYRQQ